MDRSKFTLKYFLSLPQKLLDLLLFKYGRNLSDKTYIKLKYFVLNGRWLNLKRPRTFNEKLQWLKLYGHRPEYVDMADKYKVKAIVSNLIGDKYVVPCLGVWEKVEQLDFEKLPEKFVLKCTHDSGGNYICRDKKSLDKLKAIEILDNSLKQGYFFQGRDKQYRDIERRIIADTFLDDGREGELQDYKFWCFNGVPKVIYLTNKGKKVYENFYDMDFAPLDIDHGFPRMVPEYQKPVNFELMKELASKLSKGVPFVRVDFFDVDGKVYFGEFTFFDWGGFKNFKSNKWDEKLGSWIELPNRS
ncbi:MAG: glycosyl transferase [Bacteroides sp.]|nr:glycosyl transferase [Bacteroides sp.]